MVWGLKKEYFPKVLLFDDCCLHETRSCNKSFELTNFYVWVCGFRRNISLLGSLSNKLKNTQTRQAVVVLTELLKLSRKCACLREPDIIEVLSKTFPQFAHILVWMKAILDLKHRLKRNCYLICHSPAYRHSNQFAKISPLWSTGMWHKFNIIASTNIQHIAFQ